MHLATSTFRRLSVLPSSPGPNGASGRSRASDARNGRCAARCLVRTGRPRTPGVDQVSSALRMAPMPPIASSATESPTAMTPSVARRRLRAAEEAHRVVERQVRDEVAALRWLEHDAAALVPPGASQQQQPIRHVDPTRDGARLGGRPVALDQAGDGRCVRLLELRGGSAPDVRDDHQRLGGLRRVDGQGAVVIPQVERARLAQPLEGSPRAADEDVHVAMEGDQPLAAAHLERLAAADPAGDAHRARGQRRPRRAAVRP